MSHRFWLGCLLLLIGSAAQAEVLYQRDIQPIFTAKCVACHACYDSPCQLNLGSGEAGVVRTNCRRRSKAQDARRRPRRRLDAPWGAASR